VWARAAELGVHAVVTIFEHQFGELRTVLEQFPEVPVSLDHCGFPPLAGAPWTEAQPLFALADLPNLHCKVTTNSIELARAKGGNPQSFIGELVRHFGADRVMWGSDFCQTHDRSYADLVALARDAFGELSHGEQAACLGGTANETDHSTRISCHMGLACQPDFMLSKPGLGADEALMIQTNEMARTLALLQHRG